MQKMLPALLFMCGIVLDNAQSNTPQTYHVAFLGLDTPVSIEFLYADSAHPTASAEVVNCEDLPFNVEITTANFQCISSLFPQGTNVFDSRAVKIKASTDDPIHVNVKHNGADEGFLAIPDDALGTEYYVATFCKFGGHCQFSVTPVEDATSIMIHFPVNVTGPQVCLSGVDVSSTSSSDVPLLLDEFDVAHFESTSDLTGTYIMSDKKIAVFVGARNMPSHMIEQLPPVNKWGKNFHVLPNKLNFAGDEVIILAGTPTTKIDIRGFKPFVIPYAGQFVTRRIDWGMYTNIETSSPVLMVQLMSFDIYNDSTSVQGNPSMVLVQSVEHYSNAYTFYMSEDPASDPSVYVALVAATSVKDNIYMPAPTVGGIWNQIGNLDMWAAFKLMNDQIQEIKHTSQEPFGLYGYFGRSRATLIGMNWNVEAGVCVQPASAPGDGMDNDCDGEIDEDDTCTEQDLSNTFTLQDDTQHIIPVGGQQYITFTVKSCGVVFATLKTAAPSTSYFLVELVPDHIHVHVCSPDCTVDKSKEKDVTPANTFNCGTTASSYWMTWSDDELKVDTGTSVGSADADPLSLIISETPETIVFSSVFDGAEIHTDISTKDCAKIISGQADSGGKSFFIPLADADSDFTIYITPFGSNPEPTSVNIASLSGIKLLSNKEVTSVTERVTKTQLSSGGEWGQGIRIEAVREISVFVVRKKGSADRIIGFHVLPKDILGTSFTVAGPSSQPNAGFITEYDSTVLIDPALSLDKNTYQTKTGIAGPITLTRPMAVFSITAEGNILAQMPPTETLGLEYYIPAFDLTAVSATGTLIVTSTEDSTYVIIKGAYDEGYEEDYRGDEVRRDYDNNTKMTVQSSKPVLVSLYLEGSNGQWAAMITIPATDQYKSQHVFPALGDDVQFISSVAVSKNGDVVTSTIVDNGLSSTQTTYYQSPTFSLTFVKSTASQYQDAIFVIKSDEKTANINSVCVLSEAVINDGDDNDCDGQIDEEYCYSNNEPGYLDYDIDGEINEDCKETSDSYVPSSAFTLNILSTPLPCPGTTPPTTPGTTAIGGEGSGSGPGSTSLGTLTPTAPTTAHYEHPNIEFPDSTSNTVTVVAANSSSTTPSSRSTAAPAEENCFTDCICPCGWVNVQNYTAEEIQKKVVEIQKKLKIDKAILSAQVRKKTSAKDNRPAAMGIGYIGLAFLIVTIGSIFLLDLTSISRDIMLLRENLRDVFAQ